MKLTFLDVQHGSACHIETPSGLHMMFDIGTGDFDESQGGPTHSPLRYLHDTLKVERLDCVIISHPHRDHIDDIENFSLLQPRTLHRLKHLSEEFIRGGNKPSDQSKISKYFEICNDYDQPIGVGESPFDPPNNGFDMFKIFTPKPASDNLNDHSSAAVIAYAGTKVLLTGDTEKAGWENLLNNSSFVEAIKGTNIFLAPHHGRENGYYEELYSKMGVPQLTIISDTNVGTTCARQRYREKSSGWEVYSRKTNVGKERFCLTTRNDGTIQVSCGINGDGSRFRNVTTK